MLDTLMTKQTEKLGNAFADAGFEVRFVGGCVRDVFLGVEPKDVDFCTNATPDEMLKVAEDNKFKFLPTGLQHGTVTLVVDGEPFEVTTLRVDVETDGRHAEVEFTRDFERDAERRDLTMNAMSMDFNGMVYDYFGGLNDLGVNRVRFVGNAADRVKEDYLRVLRYFRFAARFDADMDLDDLVMFSQPEVLDGLSKVSVERYWQEMSKLLDPSVPGRVRVMNVMFQTKVAYTLGFTRFVPAHLRRSDNSLAALSTFLEVGQEDKFFNFWKMSKYEEAYVRNMVANRWVDWNFDVVQDKLTLEELPLDQLVSTLKVAGKLRLAEMAAEFDVPAFPVTGQDLLNSGMKPGPEVGNKMRELKEVWAQSRYTMTKEELMKGM